MRLLFTFGISLSRDNEGGGFIVTDWAKDVLAKYVSIKSKSQADEFLSESTKRRALLDKGSDRRWLMLRDAVDNAVKDLNETGGCRLFSSESPKSSELRIRRIGEPLLFSADYDQDAHQVSFRGAHQVNAMTYTLTVQPVDNLDAVVLLNPKGISVDDNTAEAQNLISHFLESSLH